MLLLCSLHKDHCHLVGNHQCPCGASVLFVQNGDKIIGFSAVGSKMGGLCILGHPEARCLVARKGYVRPHEGHMRVR